MLASPYDNQEPYQSLYRWQKQEIVLSFQMVSPQRDGGSRDEQDPKRRHMSHDARQNPAGWE
jgi:hypothetical protein